MSPLVKTHDHTVGLDFELSTSFYELAIELCGFRFVTAMQRRGQPALAPMSQHGQGHIHIAIEPHLTGQTVEVKEIDARSQAVFDAVAPRVVHH